ncbi:Ferrous iron transport protein B [Dolichospermum sp. UHCC 0315A]|jgi:ferrous iron transport protein B|uniref:ferrous iron transport protein B n=1 Tax=Dolichospermum sp. UHCC 0315A TaxID=1914871 RepID=UPI00125A07FD|nr:ferrous iron transport protein B [Dolichospermum sp. UHCC 0315A]QEI42884.1 Ferrous iron transport protein B [Dolichospermum sp. UHCC 0315A]
MTIKQIAVLGMPNTGKSTFFNRFTGANASIGNWPGMTVDLMMAKIKVGEEEAEVVDLPGIYDLRGFSEDEAVVRRFLESTPIHLVIIILNATQLDRQISLALQIKHLHLPAVLLLNMADEAPKFGVKIEPTRIAKHLGIPVLPISAKYGDGYDQAVKAIAQTLQQQQEAVTAGSLAQCSACDSKIASEMSSLLEDAVYTPEQVEENLTTRLDRILLHPVFGLPLFFAAMFLMFQIVYALGTPVQKFMGDTLDWFKGVALEPVLGGLPAFLKGFLIHGLYTGMGTVAAFIPVIVLFFFCMAIVEDSGYLSRSAFLMDAFMERLGLDGRSFVMSLMGFGCNVPAIMGTRVMRSPGLRMLSMLVIPFSLCSARLNVFIFMTTALFYPHIAPVVLFSLYLFSFVAAILTAFLFRGRYPNKEPLVLELPPYRFPTIKQMWLRAWGEIRHFLKWSNRFIIFGVVAIWLLNNLPFGVPIASSQTLSGMIGQATQPLLAPIGINAQLAVALIFGFIAKEIVLGGLAVIYGKSQGADLMGTIAHQIDWVQAYSFMLFTLLYVPCLSTVAVLKSESKSWKFAVISVVWSVGLAWVTSFIFYQSARALGF